MIKRLLVAALAFAAGAYLTSGAEAADRLRIAIQKTGTASWEIELIKARGLDKAANLDLETTELASTEAAKIALVGGAADMVVGDWLWVGARTCARRQAPVHALFDRARRGDGAEGFAGPHGRRSRRPVDRRRRRAARQELAHAARGGARRGPSTSPRTPGPHTARRRSSPRSSPRARPTRRSNSGISPPISKTRGFRRAIEMADVEKALGATRPGRDDRLYLQRKLRRLAQGRAQALFRRDDRGAQDPAPKIRSAWAPIKARLRLKDDAALAVYRQRYLEGVPKRTIAEEAADARILYRRLADGRRAGARRRRQGARHPPLLRSRGERIARGAASHLVPRAHCSVAGRRAFRQPAAAPRPDDGVRDHEVRGRVGRAVRRARHHARPRRGGVRARDGGRVGDRLCDGAQRGL